MRVILLSILLIFTPWITYNQVVINEFMASNGTIITDNEGEYDDWIELFNTSSDTIDIGGMFLTDDPASINKWKIPAATVINGNSYLLIWADDTDSINMHTNFRLSAGGEYIALVDTSGINILDDIHYGSQSTDISYGRYPDGSDNWILMINPTPGSGNTDDSEEHNIDHWETVIFAGDSFRYFVGTDSPPADWKELSFNDSSWSAGPGGIGYGDGDDNTVIEPAISLFLRKKFQIFDTSTIEYMAFHIDFDDSFVASINGTEIARENLTGVDPAYDQYADFEHEAKIPDGGVPDFYEIDKENAKEILLEGENVLAVQVHNISDNSSDMSSTCFLSAGLNDTMAQYNPTPDWFYVPGMYMPGDSIGYFSSNLPIAIVNTGGIEIPDEPKVDAQMGIIYNGPGEENTTDDPYSHYYGLIGIELRGTSTIGFPKKSYLFETRLSNGENNNVSLLGMPSENDWILNGPYSDKTLMRNVLTFEISRRMGYYAPRTRFCELVLNGEYLGVYVLMEKVKRDQNRVNIARLEYEDISGDALTGGYLLKLDWDAEPGMGFRSQVDNTMFIYEDPGSDELHSEQKDYISDFIHEFESMLNGNDYLDAETGYKNYINLNSFVDFFISQELARNCDAYRLSTFLYKDRDSIDPELNFGPLWDFNIAYGNQWERDYYLPAMEDPVLHDWDADSWSMNWDLDPINFWWDRFMTDPVFTDQIITRWEEYRNTILRGNEIYAIIDSLSTELRFAQERNFDLWPLDEELPFNYYIFDTYQEEVDFLKEWISERLTWMDLTILGFEMYNSISLNKNFNVICYPNPFQDQIVFQFYLNRQQNVSINIYNLAGQKVKTIRESNQQSEKNRIVWDGTDNTNREITNGIYYCQLVIDGSAVATKKIIKIGK
jgi:hypothetical protein